MCTEDSKLDTFEVKVTNVIPFDQARPNANMIAFDDENRPMFKYTIKYRHEDRTFESDIWAYSVQDAEARLAEIRKSSTITGQVFERQPA